MNRLHTLKVMGLVLLGSCIFLSACSKENFKRVGYETVKHHQCNEQINNPGCRDDYPSYDEYQRERSEIPKQSDTSK